MAVVYVTLLNILLRTEWNVLNVERTSWNMIYCCWDRSSICISSIRVCKHSYSYLKQKQSQKGTSARLLSYPNDFRVGWAVHQRGNGVLSCTRADTFRDSHQDNKPHWLWDLLFPWSTREGRGILNQVTLVTAWKKFLQYLGKLQKPKKFCSDWRQHLEFEYRVLILLLPFAFAG